MSRDVAADPDGTSSQVMVADTDWSTFYSPTDLDLITGTPQIDYNNGAGGDLTGDATNYALNTDSSGAGNTWLYASYGNRSSNDGGAVERCQFLTASTGCGGGAWTALGAPNPTGISTTPRILGVAANTACTASPCSSNLKTVVVAATDGQGIYYAICASATSCSTPSWHPLDLTISNEGNFPQNLKVSMWWAPYSAGSADHLYIYDPQQGLFVSNDTGTSCLVCGGSFTRVYNSPATSWAKVKATDYMAGDPTHRGSAGGSGYVYLTRETGPNNPPQAAYRVAVSFNRRVSRNGLRN